MVALAAGKRPLVVPRLARFGETTDDHQVESVDALAEAELVTAVHDPLDLTRALAATPNTAWTPPMSDGLLADELQEYIRASVGRAPAVAG